MVVKFSWPDRATVEEAAARGVSEWETTTAHLSGVDELELAEWVSTAAPLRTTQAGVHAYSDGELLELVQLLHPAEPLGIAELRRWTDIFAIIMGISVLVTPKSS